MNAHLSPLSQGPVPQADAAGRLLARARMLAESGRAQAARPLLAAVRSLGGASEEVDALEARLLLRLGRASAALALLDRAQSSSGAGLALRLLRSEALLLDENPAAAAAEAAETVIAHPADAAAKAMLGMALAELGRLADAIPCLREAVQGEPANPLFGLALARAQEVAGEAEAARATLQAAIRREPGSLRLRNAALRLAISQDAFAEAVAVADAARRDGLLDACLLGMLGHALVCLGEHDRAADAYAEALKLAPEDAYLRHLVAASGRLPAPPRAADDYVRTVFDGYAENFEQHLIGLDYRVPGLLRRAVTAHLHLPGDTSTGPVLDLGCGTGFAAVAMSDLPLGPWHGVDLSPAMLRHARAKHLYETLQEASLPAWLDQPGPTYRLAVAADVLCYLGDLAPFLTALSRRLPPGGWLVASLEAQCCDRGWALGREGRYTHDPAYLRETAAACGFMAVAAETEVLRTQHGSPVAGTILVLMKPEP